MNIITDAFKLINAPHHFFNTTSKKKLVFDHLFARLMMEKHTWAEITHSHLYLFKIETTTPSEDHMIIIYSLSSHTKHVFLTTKNDYYYLFIYF